MREGARGLLGSAGPRALTLVLRGDTAYYPSEVHEAFGVKPFAAAAKVTVAK